MQIKRSIVLTSLVPEAIHDTEIFSTSVEVAASHGLHILEYYCDPDSATDRGNLVRSLGLGSIYLAAYYQKKFNVNLSSLVKEDRKVSVDLTKQSIDAAQKIGAERVVVSSGRYPIDSKEAPAAWGALHESLHTLLEYAGKDLLVSLEPGDRVVQAMQLAGPTNEVVGLAMELSKSWSNFRLTMDTSHLMQLGEEPKGALIEAAPFCDHVHLANCVLEKASPLYGDKHPHFDAPGAVFTRVQLQNLATFLVSNYKKPDLTLGIEVIAAQGIEALHTIFESEEWFFSRD